jgi:hypothetical protein
MVKKKARRAQAVRIFRVFFFGYVRICASGIMPFEHERQALAIPLSPRVDSKAVR